MQAEWGFYVEGTHPLRSAKGWYKGWVPLRCCDCIVILPMHPPFHLFRENWVSGGGVKAPPFYLYLYILFFLRKIEEKVEGWVHWPKTPALRRVWTAPTFFATKFKGWKGGCLHWRSWEGVRACVKRWLTELLRFSRNGL